MPEKYYLDVLYPLQDKVLKTIDSLQLDFYLTGGTALGRCYLNHRYSDDLDFFVNGHKDFKKQGRAAIEAVRKLWKCEIANNTDSFIRLFVTSEAISLKIDLVNDVPYHFGEIIEAPIFTRIDSWRNILSNKLCALSRLETKDVADIVFIARKFNFEWETIIAEAKEKDLWVDPLQICQLLNQFPINMMSEIKWIKAVDLKKMGKQINQIHDDIFTGARNTLFAQ